MNAILTVFKMFTFILLTLLAVQLRAQTDTHQHDGHDHDHGQTEMPALIHSDYQAYEQAPQLKLAEPFKLSKDLFPTGKFTPSAMNDLIKKIGKDSVSTLISEAIWKSKRMLESVSSGRLDAHVSLELMLVDRKYKLGIDPYMSLYNDVSGMIYKLYGKKFGIPKDLQAMIDTLAAQKLDMYDEFVQDLGKADSRYGLAVFGDEVLISDRMLDTLYRYVPNIQTPLDRIRYYWVFAELCRDQVPVNALAVEYRSKLFKTLYKEYNAASLVAIKQDTSITDQTKLDQIQVASLMAYGLYGGDLTLEKHGSDILFLLSSMDPTGGWHRYVVPLTGVDYNLTAYAIWALAEAREQLKSYEPPKQ